MSTIGRAIIEIGADGSNFEGEVRSSVRPSLGDIGTAVSGIGDSISSLGGSLTRGITLPALGAAGAAAGITATLGWGRLSSVDTAQAQLRGLGYEAEDVDRITDQLTTDLEGGMMTMAEATFASANAMAAGVKEGDELTKYIQNLDAAAVGGTGTFEEMEQIFSRVAGEGSLTRREFDMMGDRVAGFREAVADHAGATGDELYQMLNDGAISYDDFLTIMEDHGGDFATEYAKTWEGMVQNTKNWVGIIGETLLGGAFEQAKESIAEFLEFLSSDEVLAWAEDMAVHIGDAFEQIIDRVQQAIEWWMNLDGETQKLIATIAGIAVAAGPVLLIIGKIISAFGGFLTAISTIGGHITTLTSSLGLAGGSGGFGALLRGALRFLPGAGLIVAAILEMWDRSEGFREAVFNLGESIWEGAQRIWEALAPVLEQIGELFGSLTGDGPLGQFVNFMLDTLEPAFIFVVDAITIAFDTVVGVIEGALGIISGVLDVFIALFTGDWERLGEGLMSIVEGLWDVISSIFTGAFELIVGLLESFVETAVAGWTGLWDLFGESLTSAWEWITELFSGAWESLVEWFTGALESLSELWTNIWETISEWFSGWWEGLTELVSGAWEGIVAFFSAAFDAYLQMWVSIFTGILDFVTGVWDSISSAISSAWDFISSALSAGLSFISDLWSSIWNAISSAVSAVWSTITGIVSGAISGVQSTISSVMSAIQGVFSSIWNAISSTISSVLSSISSIVSSVWSSITSAISSFMSSISSTISSIWNSIISAISGFMSSIMSSISSAWDSVVSTVSTAVGNVLSSVTETFGEVVSFVTGIPGKLMSALGDLGTLFLDSGKALIGGLVDGITGAFGSARDAISDGLGGLRNLLPFSPAKEGPFSGRGYTLYSGRALMEDFGKGIEDQEAALQRSMGDVAESASEAFKPKVDMPDVGKAAVDGVREGVSVSSARPPRNGPDDPYGGGRGASGGSGGDMVFKFEINTLQVDSEDRVKQTAQALYDRAERKARARGKVNLGGAVE